MANEFASCSKASAVKLGPVQTDEIHLNDAEIAPILVLTSR